MGSLSATIKKIQELKAEVDRLSPINKEDSDRLWKKFRLEWNYNSNHIEGNTLTYGETQLLLLFDKTTGDHEMREFEEMKAHDVAVFTIKNWASEKERELTEADIRELNQLILVRPYWKEALTYDGQPTRRQIKVGEYKEHPNSVRLANGEMFHYATPEDVPIKMRELIEWFRENQQLHPVVLAAELHYRFILIHPFDDGNGRIARLLVNYVLMKNDLPPIIIKSAKKNEYLTALNKADVGDREAFHEYMAEQLVWSLNISLKAAKGESVEEDDDLDKEISLLKKEVIEGSILYKSPKIVYNVFSFINDNVWSRIKNELSEFDSFYSESVTKYFVNGLDEKRAKKSLMNSFAEAFDNSVRIFGHDVYDSEIFYIKWLNTKYGVKTTGDIHEILLRVDFDKNQYSVKSMLNNKVVSVFELTYKERLEKSEIDSLLKSLKRALLATIKES